MPVSPVELVSVKGGYRTSCTRCHEPSIVAAPVARRIALGEHRLVCKSCRELEQAMGCAPGEDYRLWWLCDVAGLTLAEAGEVLERRRPLPALLVELLAGAGFLDDERRAA